MWLILPAVVFLVAVVGWPVLQALYYSLFSDSLSGIGAFTGLSNYTKALVGTGSGDFWASFWTTTQFTVISIILETLIGLGMALIMNRAFRGRGLVRTSVLVPWAIPTAVTAKLWGWMLFPDGIVNAITGRKIIWTGSEWPSKWAIIFADTWKTAPFIALLLLAGLQIIPGELYEAAKVDGATAWQRFTQITIPLLKPALLVAILFRILDVLRIYDLPAILTGGANNTKTLSILVVQEAIGGTKFGYGSALSTLTFVYIFVVAFAFVKLLGANVVQTQAREVK